MPVAGWGGSGLTCIDDVADSPRAQGVIEWDHHHGICVAGQLRNDPLWRHTRQGAGKKGRLEGFPALRPR